MCGDQIRREQEQNRAEQNKKETTETTGEKVEGAEGNQQCNN